MHGYPNSASDHTPRVHACSRSYNVARVKQVWKVKNSSGLCNIVLTLFRSSTKGDWYFDSGNSRHMTGDKNYISKLKVVGSGQVTFDNDAIGKIVGKGKLKHLD